MNLHDSPVPSSLEAAAWSAIADAYPAMLYMASADGQIEWVNRRWYDVMGVPRGGDITSLWHTLVHPTHSADVLASWERSIASGQAFSEEVLCRFADQSYHWVVSKAEPVRDDANNVIQWFGTILEVDDRKEIERALLKSELRFRALTDNIDEIVWVADGDWNVTYLNRRYAEYTGIPLAQALGTGWQRALPASELEFVKAEFERATLTGTLSHQHQLFNVSSGEYRWNWLRAHRVSDPSGSNEQWFGTITDIHDQKVAMEKKNEALDAFQLALLPRHIAAVPDCGVSTLYVSASEEARIGG